jgi:hypothetical protein
MYRKYFFKSKGVLSRKFVASGLAAVFSAGMFGSYAEAMEKNVIEMSQLNNYDKINKNEKKIIVDILNTNFLIFFKEKKTPYYIEEALKYTSEIANRTSKVDFFKDILTTDFEKKLLEFINEENYAGILAYMLLCMCRDSDHPSMSLYKDEISFRSQVFAYIKKKGSKFVEEIISKFSNTSHESINLASLAKNQDNKKNKCYSKAVVIVPIGLIIIAIILSIKGKSNTGVPNNNNNNKDDEKVNPSIDPVIPSTDPKSDDQNSQQNNQEERPSVVLSNILKAAGATVTAGTLAYLFNKVSKSGKPSEVKNSSNVDGEFMYLDSAGNKVTKTEEGRKDNYDNDDKNADNSGTKQLLEDKSTEKPEEGQEEFLENSTLSDDTEVTSDEDKNKD